MSSAVSVAQSTNFSFHCSLPCSAPMFYCVTKTQDAHTEARQSHNKCINWANVQFVASLAAYPSMHETACIYAVAVAPLMS